MPRSGNTYSRPAGQPVSAGTTIDATVFNNLTADIASELTRSWTNDGTGTPTANIPMNNFRFTGLGNGSLAGDSATLGQVQGGGTTWLSGVAGTNTVTGNASPAVTAYSAGQTFSFVPAATNTGAATLQINGAGTAQQVFAFGVACAGGELIAGVPVTVVHDGTRFNIVNPFLPRLNFQQTAFSLSSSVVTSLPNAAYTRVSLVESFDPGNNIPVSANYYVAPAAGTYFFYASLAVAITSAAVSSVQIALERANNAGVNISITNMATSIVAAVSTPQVLGALMLGANAGDRFYLMGFQNNGGARDATAGGACYLGGWRLT